MSKKLKHIIDYKILDNYSIWLKYDDGVNGVIDLSDYLNYPVFAPIKNVEFFNKLKIEEGRNVFWNDELDLCPDALYIKITGINPYA
jgi:Protein of unknown function (DUF2442)